MIRYPDHADELELQLYEMTKPATDDACTVSLLISEIISLQLVHVAPFISGFKKLGSK